MPAHDGARSVSRCESTTLIVGTRAIASGLADTQGLLTETPLLAKIPLQNLQGPVFGGHEVRRGSVQAAALEIHENTGTIPYPLLDKLSKTKKNQDFLNAMSK